MAEANKQSDYKWELISLCSEVQDRSGFAVTEVLTCSVEPDSPHGDFLVCLFLLCPGLAEISGIV